MYRNIYFGFEMKSYHKTKLKMTRKIRSFELKKYTVHITKNKLTEIYFV